MTPPSCNFKRFDINLEGIVEELPNGDVWTIGKKIYQADYDDRKSSIHEIRQVYECVQIQPNRGYEAILKLRAQLASKWPLHPDPAVRAMEAQSALSYPAAIECEALEQLSEKHCTSTADLIYLFTGTQSYDLWVPGGYLVSIFMEKLSGTTLTDFWERDRQERDRIREAFKQSYSDIMACGIYHMDKASRNLIWDNEKEKCYIIDFDKSIFLTEDEITNYRFSNVEFLAWNLDDRKRNETNWDKISTFKKTTDVLSDHISC